MNVTKRCKTPFLELITRRSQVQVLYPQPKKPRRCVAFSFCLFCGRPLPRGIVAGIFLVRRQEIARQKNTHFFMAGERGNTSTKTGHTKTNDTMMIIKYSISSVLVFRTLGRNGALVFSAAFRRRLFHLYLFFHSNASPGFFIFPCFLQGSAGEQSGV